MLTILHKRVRAGLSPAPLSPRTCESASGGLWWMVMRYESSSVVIIPLGKAPIDHPKCSDAIGAAAINQHRMVLLVLHRFDELLDVLGIGRRRDHWNLNVTHAESFR